MHAYLFVSNNVEELQKEARKFAQAKGKQVLEFSVQKIPEVRELNKFLSLSLTQPTSILIKDVDKATLPALNAFLKTLEEPQENVVFILTARSEYKVLPTILSRCQIIRIRNKELEIKNRDLIDKFLISSIGEKFTITDSLRKREDAVSFMEELIHNLHQRLIKDREKAQVAERLIVANDTLASLNANGNVGLHLTNLVIRLE